MRIKALRLSIFPLHYRVAFEGEARVMAILLRFLKSGKKWNETAERELNDDDIDQVLRQIDKGV